MRVLIIDDSKTTRELIKVLIEPRGVTAVEAADGAAALKAISQAAPSGAESFDVVLVDLELPDMNGLEVVQRIREICAEEVPKLVAMSAHDSERHRQRCAEVGIDAYLAKPLSEEELRKVIQPETLADAEADEVHRTPLQCLPFELPGFDVQVGLRRVRGDLVLYLRLLRIFAAASRNTADELEQAVLNGNVADIRAICHALRGAAGAIGGTALCTLAGEIEREIEAGANQRVKELQVALCAQLDLCVTSIGVFEGDVARAWSGGPQRCSKSRVAALLRRVQIMISDGDSRARHVLDALHGELPDGECRAHLHELEVEVFRFDHEKALDRVTSMASLLGIELEGAVL